MRAGRLRHLVQIQAPTETRGATGEVLETFATLSDGEVWAGIEPLSGRELTRAGAEGSEHSVRIVCRYVGSVTTRCRVIFGARVFQVLAVINSSERGVDIELACKEVSTT